MHTGYENCKHASSHTSQTIMTVNKQRLLKFYFYHSKNILTALHKTPAKNRNIYRFVNILIERKKIL